MGHQTTQTLILLLFPLLFPLLKLLSMAGAWWLVREMVRSWQEGDREDWKVQA